MSLKYLVLLTGLVPSLGSSQINSGPSGPQSSSPSGQQQSSGLIAPNFGIPIAPAIQTPPPLNAPSSSSTATSPGAGASVPGLFPGGAGSGVPGLIAPQMGFQQPRPSPGGPPGSLGLLNPTGSSPSNAPSLFPNNRSGSTAPARELKAPPVITYDPRTATRVKPIISVKTSEGEFKLRLDPNLAPRNVENFVELAMGRKEFVDAQTSKKVKRPFYTGLLCHKILKNVLVQCGCPFGNGRGGPGYFLPDELSEQSRLDREGLIAMAPINTRPDGKRDYQSNSNGSQFFITLGPWPEPEEKFTVIGSVIEGMAVIRKISRLPVGPTDRPIKRVIIYSIDVENEPQVEVQDPLQPSSVPVPTLGTSTPLTRPNANRGSDSGRGSGPSASEPLPGEMDADPLSGGIQ